jgi:hypothetical protein
VYVSDVGKMNISTLIFHQTRFPRHPKSVFFNSIHSYVTLLNILTYSLASGCVSVCGSNGGSLYLFDLE